jgi:arginyl-tRNA synthetase
MKNVLEQKFKKAIQAALGDEFAHVNPSMQPTKRPEYGDYQANFALTLAKQLQRPPREIAELVKKQLVNDEFFQQLEVSGPGFINITLHNNYLQQAAIKLFKDPRLGIAKVDYPETVVVDYGSANVAKEMHVGHLRTAIIGDAVVRILDFLGHTVIRQNHLGDWGTQFGMLLEYLIVTNQHHSLHLITDINSLYKEAKAKFDSDTNFAECARNRVVALQAKEAFTYALWQRLVNETKYLFQDIYDRLGILLTDADIRGESFYNDVLPELVDELEKQGIAQKDDGATVIFLEGYVNPDNQPLPFIIQKKDGGYLYATTDLAAAKFRIKTLNATRLIYVTDARQKQHFSMLFDSVKKAGWANDNIKLEHLPFGAILGEEHKPLKTRSGELIRLTELLDKAQARAQEITLDKNPDLPNAQLLSIAHTLSIAALKYSDLRVDKVKDYVFSWDKMLSFEGNTAPYLQNAYVRIQSLFRKANVNIETLGTYSILIETLYEHVLVIRLLEFPELIYGVANDLALHKLCEYMYDIASSFHQFYEHCPILSAESSQVKESRLLLAYLVAQTLALGFNLLGIEIVKRM